MVKRGTSTSHAVSVVAVSVRQKHYQTMWTTCPQQPSKESIMKALKNNASLWVLVFKQDNKVTEVGNYYDSLNKAIKAVRKMNGVDTLDTGWTAMTSVRLADMMRKEIR